MPGRDPALPETLVEAALGLVDQAASLAMDHWVAGAAPARHWEKAPGQPVSEADLLVDAFLRERLTALLPGSGWLSEESVASVDRAGARDVWIVDPIDGTRDFVRGRTGWAVSVALAREGDILFAALAAPARAERWRAVKGAGAWRNDARLTASHRTALPGARVPIESLSAPDRDLACVPKPNSIALRMAMVAANEADLVASVRWGAEWDIAAASLIAQEAGACVTDAAGHPLVFNRDDPACFGVLCTAPGIHAAAVARLKDRADAALAHPRG